MPSWREKARALKQEVKVICLAARHPQTPWYAKLAAGCVLAYALSPIDLIPDPIPVLGYLDDLVIVPLGLAFTIKLIPSDIMCECRARAAQAGGENKPKSWLGAGIIILIWLGLLFLGIWLIRRLL
jgi:uncharacterized membrane protein YkvA (DUF1232 family)